MKRYLTIYTTGWAVAFLLFACFSFIIAILVKTIGMEMPTFYWLTLSFSFITMLISGIIVGKKCRRNGLLCGFLFGVSCIMIIYFIQTVLFQESYRLEQWREHLGFMFFTSIGSVFGVNSGQQTSKT